MPNSLEELTVFVAGHYLVVAEVRHTLSVSKGEA
jgi:hypothetical protein